MCAYNTGNITTYNNNRKNVKPLKMALGQGGYK